MSRIQNPAPDATRRRASTNRKMETIMRLARRLPLTRQVLADQLETATPSQMEFMDQWMNAEIESRERSKRSRLLKQAGFPAVKTLDGYDWENIRFPVDWGRRSLESLEFASRPEDVVMFGHSRHGQNPSGDGVGKEGLPGRHDGTVLHRRWPGHALVARQHGRQTRQGNRVHRQGPPVDHRRVGLRADRRGRQPVVVPGHHQRVRDAIHRLHHEHRVQRVGPGCSGIRTWPRRSSTGPCITAGCSGSRASPIAGLMLLCNETIKHEQ